MRKTMRREPLIWELSSSGRVGAVLPLCDVPGPLLPERYRRERLDLPEMSELDLVRHFTRLSQSTYCVETHFYPRGGCTMKYSPKVNECIARLSGFAQIHPYQDAAMVQGALKLLYELQQYLCEISGLEATSLQPAAGAQGLLAGMLIAKKYHHQRMDTGRRKVIVTEGAHGSNPATLPMCGYSPLRIGADEQGNISLTELDGLMDRSVAAIILANPNTLGLFEREILEVAKIVHDRGGLVLCDGANMNGLLGIVKPAALGVDIIQFNIHKTFGAPHGGAGPGAGPISVTEELAQFLPVPLVVRRAATPKATQEAGSAKQDVYHYYLDFDRPQSIGRVKAFYGNFSVLVKAYCYIRRLGAVGLRPVSENAVMNANYLMHRLREYYAPVYERTCMHECLLSAKQHARKGMRAYEVGRRLLERGFMPPLCYFPRIVEEAMLIEPTEGESLETLDAFVQAMVEVAREEGGESSQERV